MVCSVIFSIVFPISIEYFSILFVFLVFPPFNPSRFFFRHLISGNSPSFYPLFVSFVRLNHFSHFSVK